jgi:hypothetical protein
MWDLPNEMATFQAESPAALELISLLTTLPLQTSMIGWGLASNGLEDKRSI